MIWKLSGTFRAGAFSLKVDLEEHKRITFFIGPNGSGKSTLLKNICGASTPQEGHILLQDRVLFHHETGCNIPMQKRNVGYVPQGAILFPHLNAEENVAFGLRFSGLDPDLIQSKVKNLLSEYECLSFSKRYPHQLSGGENKGSPLRVHS